MSIEGAWILWKGIVAVSTTILAATVDVCAAITGAFSLSQFHDLQYTVTVIGESVMDIKSCTEERRLYAP